MSRLVSAFGEEFAEHILMKYVSGIIEMTQFTLTDCVVIVMGKQQATQAEIVTMNCSALLQELNYNILVLQQTDVIFSWQLSKNLLLFNVGKRHEHTS